MSLEKASDLHMWRVITAAALMASALGFGFGVFPQPYARAAREVANSWEQAWPMVGHDPQRTHRSPVVGPLNPRLLFTHSDAEGPPILGPDGRIYTWANGGLLALDASGHQLWLHRAFLLDGGPPVLANDGRVMADGFVSDVTSLDTSAVLAVKRSGKLAWKIQPAAFSKSAPPLVSARDVLYVPYVGPTEVNSGLARVPPSGRGRVLQHGFSFFAVALGRDGSIFGLGRYPSREASLSVERLSPQGKVLWTRQLGSNGLGLLVGEHGIIYVSNGNNVGSETGSKGFVAAYTPHGRLLWRVHSADGMSTLAQASDGTIRVAGQLGLSAISPGGHVLWHVPLGRSERDALPSIVVDSAGTAYVGSGDGMMRIFGADGGLESSLDVGPPSTAEAPAIAIGADGRIVVTGSDGVLRVYGR